MSHNSKLGVKHPKKASNGNSTMITQFGERAISDQNFSKIICLNKTALANLGNPSKVNVALVVQGDEKFIKLSPVAEKKKEVVSN